MSYCYQTQRPNLFTEHGVKMLLGTLDNARKAFSVSGSCTNSIVHIDGAADGWDCIAVCDYLVELGYLKWVSRQGNTDVFLPGSRMEAKP